MSTISLKIYDKDKKTVKKVYTNDTYELMFGTVEDIMSIIDVDKASDKTQLTKMLLEGFNQLKDLLKDVFPGITDEELKNVKVKDLIPVFVEICKSIVDDLGLIKQGN